MSASLIDGKTHAANLQKDIAKKVSRLKDERGITLGLAVVLLGEDPASQIYVRNKIIAAKRVGIKSFEYCLPATTSERALLRKIYDLNSDPNVHGVLVQFPLPQHIGVQNIIEAINPKKDVDGLHPINAGRLASGQSALVPCTALGSVILIKEAMGEQKLAGLNAVVLGRSNLVGKPVAQLLLRENATVTIAHSRSQNLKELCRCADLLVVAVGRAQMVKGDWIKLGAVVIDVGINRIPIFKKGPEKEVGRTRLVGDVAFDEAVHRAAYITPVPGGVGPMTVACLLHNTLLCATA